MEIKLNLLLSYLRALSQLYQNMHWTCSGDNYYGDHLLYERMYDDMNDEIDAVAERAIGLSNDSSVIDLKEDAKLTSELVEKLEAGDVESAIFAEKALLDMIADMMNQDTTDGLEDLLQGIASKSEEHLYLLQQRSKKSSAVVRLFKLAGALDKMSQYKIATDIDNVMRELASRVGISREDMVALADELDSQGHTQAANQMDAVVKNAATEEELMRQIEELKRQKEQIQAERGSYVEHEDPTSQSKKEKENQRRIRRQMETDEDRAAEEAAKNKLRRELGKKQVDRSPKKIVTREKVDEERRRVEEFMSANPGKVNEPTEETIISDEELSDEGLLRKYPTSSIYSGEDVSFPCATRGHQDREAVIKLNTGDVLGEDMPQLTFCAECATNVNVAPIGDKILGVDDPKIREFLTNKFYNRPKR